MDLYKAIDKTVNQALKWESVTLSAEEMAEMIEKDIILRDRRWHRRLRKIMQKRWVIFTGNGLATRTYTFHLAEEDCYLPIQIVFSFYVMLPILHTITIQDTEKQIEYFLPDGRQHALALQCFVLSKLDEYDKTWIQNEKTDSNITPGTSCVAESRDEEKNTSENSCAASLADTVQSENGEMILTFCTNCGVRLDVGQNFCTSCGAPVHTTTKKYQ